MQMNKTFFLLAFLSLFVLSGCWDSIELNDQAFVLGIAADVTQDGKYQVSAQVANPTAMGNPVTGGGQGEKYTVVTENGETYYEAFENLEAKISRILTRGQRQSVYIGEKLAKQGINDIIDVFTRDQHARVMGDISIVKGKQALDAIKVSVPLESTSSMSSLKIHEKIDEKARTTLLDFLVVNSFETMNPSLPVIEIEQTQNTPLQSAGRAILNQNLELVGFLNKNETNDLLWILGKLTHQDITASIPQGEGKLNLRATNLKSKITPKVSKYKTNFTLNLTAKGEVRLNNTNFDLTKPDRVETLEHELEKYFKERVSQLIKRVQEEYETDIFGFSDALFRKDPSQWKKVKNEWEKEFSEADISVNVDLTIHLIGLTGSSQQKK